MDNKNTLIPIAIVLAGLLVAGAVFMTRGGGNNNTANNNGQDEETTEVINIKPISASDHILGNPDAEIVIVEFSDFECPFCKQFHVTMNQIIDEYGKDGRVAWVYRQFPLVSLHPKAPKESEASECAAELGGNEAFWAYADRLFEITPSNNGLDLAQLPIIAEEIGLDVVQFNECLDSGRHASTVQAQVDDAIASGGRGTPHNVFMIKGEEPIPVSGALPYEQIRSLIEQTLLTF